MEWRFIKCLPERNKASCKPGELVGLVDPTEQDFAILRLSRPAVLVDFAVARLRRVKRQE